MNRISGSRQDEEPENFQGGIIADPMGLGKTLTMIALTASDLIPVSHGLRGNSELGLASVGQTLVIVPPPRRFALDVVAGIEMLINHPTVIGTWEEQLTE